MAYLIGMIAFGGLAVAVLILWDRIGRLEFQVKGLHAAIQKARGAVDEEPAGPTAMAVAAATSRQPLLPLEPPSEAQSSTAPPPEPTVARLMPERDSAPGAATDTGIQERQKPAAMESDAAEPVAPIEPPFLSMMKRTSPFVRLRLSVRVSISIATPPGP